MGRNKLLEMLDAGFRRFYSEGFTRWTKNKVIAAINPSGEKRKIDDPEVQNVLEELEARGLIRLKREEEFYLEVLHD